MPGSAGRICTRLFIVIAMNPHLAAAPVAADESARPPAGFFDYLGSMVESEGELIDPLSLQETMTVGQTAEAESTAPDRSPGGRRTANNAEEVQ